MKKTLLRAWQMRHWLLCSDASRQQALENLRARGTTVDGPPDATFRGVLHWVMDPEDAAQRRMYARRARHATTPNLAAINARRFIQGREPVPAEAPKLRLIS